MDIMPSPTDLVHRIAQFVPTVAEQVYARINDPAVRRNGLNACGIGDVSGHA